MALVTCPECGAEVSDQAPSCPHCGLPLRASAKDWLIKSWGEGLWHAQKGAIAYPIAWLSITIISIVASEELSFLGELLPGILFWLFISGVFGFLMSAAAILLVVWLRSWLGANETTRNV